MLKLGDPETRYIDKIYPQTSEFEKLLRSGKKLKFYVGIDPTAPDLHLGHSTNFLLLKKFQELGHKIIILVGDFTAMIGDPSGRTTARKPMTKEEIMQNVTTYKEQVAKIIKFEGKNPAEIKFNSLWLDELTSRELIQLAANVTLQQLSERDMFQKRIKAGLPISVHEFLYPLFQGYDSVALQVDVEVGGTDQTFNMLIGRELVKRYLDKEKFVITTKLLINPKTGKKLMSKSEGNYIALQDQPCDMYGKVMALPDEVIFECFYLCTTLPRKEIEEIKKLTALEAKKKLAFELVKLYHSYEAAKSAQKEFELTFQKRGTPTSMPVFKTNSKAYSIVDILVKSNSVDSRTQAKRLIEQGAIEINKKVVKSLKEEVGDREVVIKIGKRRFLKIQP